MQEGEKSTSYFFGLTKHRAKRRCMSAVKRDDGSLARTTADLCEQVHTHFAKILGEDASVGGEETSLLADETGPRTPPFREKRNKVSAHCTATLPK
jgi:hypothetical protein